MPQRRRAFVTSRSGAATAWSRLAAAFALGLLIAPAAYGQCEVQQLGSNFPPEQGSFGFGVAISGDIAVVGDFGPLDEEGKALVFRFNGMSWVQEAELRSSIDDCGNVFGYAVAVSDDVIAVGDHRAGGCVYWGATYLFRYNGQQWQHEATLPAPDGAGVFGHSVSVDGDTLLVGAPFTPRRGMLEVGSAYIYRYNGTQWVQEAELADPDPAPFNLFGWSVSISGDVALVGAHGHNNVVGRAFVFRRQDNQWILEQELAPDDSIPGQLWFGRAVSLAGDVALISAPQAVGQEGRAYIWRYQGNHGWVQEAVLQASNPVGPFPLFGWSAALSADGDTAIVGAASDQQLGFEAGAAHVFRNVAQSWREVVKLTASDGQPGDGYGFSVSVWDDTALVGAVAFNPGQVYVIAGMAGTDCNGNGEPDACDIFDRTSRDLNGNGIPDECEVPGDLDGDGAVGILDLLILLTAWGPCPDPPDECPADLDADGSVGILDLLALLANWG